VGNGAKRRSGFGTELPPLSSPKNKKNACENEREKERRKNTSRDQKQKAQNFYIPKTIAIAPITRNNSVNQCANHSELPSLPHSNHLKNIYPREGSTTANQFQPKTHHDTTHHTPTKHHTISFIKA